MAGTGSFLGAICVHNAMLAHRASCVKQTDMTSERLKLDFSHEFRGQRIAWGRLGEGEPIVLVHGTPFSSQVWRRIAPWLARRRQVYYFDLLGYGLSEKHAGQDVSLGVQNLILAEMLRHWALDLPEV